MQTINVLYHDNDSTTCSDCGCMCHIDSMHTWGRDDLVCLDCNETRHDSLAEWQCIAALEARDERMQERRL